jgi:chorismate mutase
MTDAMSDPLDELEGLEKRIDQLRQSLAALIAERNSIRKSLKDAERAKRGPRGKHERNAQIRDDFAAGASIASLARSHGISATTVRAIVYKHAG